MLLPSLKVHHKPISTGAVALLPWDDTLAKRFTLTTRFGDPYLLYGRSGKHIELPREACPVADIDTRVLGAPIDVTLKIGPKNDEQTRVEAEQRAFVLAGQSGLVVAPTGSGKTWYGCAAIASVKRKTLIIVPKQDLMDQWKARLQTFLGLKPHEIGIIQASKVSVIGKKVVLGMIHSLAMQDRYDPKIFEAFGLVLLDECHRAPADTLVRCFRNLPARIRVGYSATPKRADGKEQLLYAHVGPIRVEGAALQLVPKVLVFRSNWLVPRVMRRDPILHITKFVKMPHSGGKAGHVVKHLVADRERNDALGKLISMAYSKGRNTVVFTDSLDHVDTLFAQARANGVPMKDLARYVGGMSKEAYDLASVRRVIIATYGMMSEGTDIPWLDTAIFATPHSRVQQAAGRILREYPDKKQPLLIDFVDDDSPVFGGYFKARMLWYASIGATVVQ